MNVQDFKLYLIVGGVAIASWVLVRLTVTQLYQTGLTATHSPDFYSIGYQKREMGETGLVKTQLTAQRMTHFDDNGVIQLEKPIMYFYSETTPPWVVESEHGELSADGEDLFLGGKVSVVREQDEGIRPLTIHSANVRVKPEISYAESSEWAELISASNRTEGIGMKMVFAEPVHVELLSEVKGTYETK